MQGPNSSGRIESLARTAAGHGPSELARVDYLDGWRGLAILLVLQAHFAGVPGFHGGRMGVDVFFCLSGVLMSGILFVKRTPLDIFYKRRITRIIPSFLLYLVVVYGVSAACGKIPAWSDIAATALFLRAYLPTDIPMFATGIPTGHLWSLNVEEHCYVFLSLVTLIALARKREGWILCLFGVLSVGIHLIYLKIRATAPPGDFWIRTEVAAGNLLLAAGYSLLKHRVVPHVRSWMPVATFLAAIFLYYGAIVPWIYTMTVAPFLLAFTVNHLAETPRFVRRALSFAPLRLMGICSYSIYLWQQPFYHYRREIGAALGGQPLAVLGIAVATGFMMFYLFENPVRTRLNKIW
ncbi:MAG: acyltransferase [Verrucomicrobiales bacterium]